MQLSYIHIAPAFKPGRASQKNPGVSAQSFVASIHHITCVTDIAKKDGSSRPDRSGLAMTILPVIILRHTSRTIWREKRFRNLSWDVKIYGCFPAEKVSRYTT
jgi:hypothetical protein